MTDPELHDTVTPSRRGFLRLVGATTATAAIAGTSLHQSTQPAKAFTNNYWLNDTLIDAGDVVVEWALREFTAIVADDPPTGLTASALKQDVYQTALTRQSTNASTIVDNRNILDGIQNTAYVEAKLAAFEALNAGKSQSEVQSAGTTAIDNYHTTVQANLLKTWNEAAREVENLRQSLVDHPDTSGTNVGMLQPISDNSGGGFTGTTVGTHTLPDGTTMDLVTLDYDSMGGTTGSYDPKSEDHTNVRTEVTYDGSTVTYMRFSDWNSIFTDMNSKMTTVSNGFITWVENVYGQVQSGEVTVSDLITPKERAAMMTDDGTYPQALADLLALNVPVDLEREAKVTLDYTNGNVTLKGSLGITSPPATLSTGSYDPSADNLGSVYLTYDVSEGVGVYQSYDSAKGVDGGTIEFEAEPPSAVIFKVHTSFNEVAEFPTSDLTKGTDGSGNTVWTVDVSGQLDNQIADIDKVEYVSQTQETQYETIQITGPFTIESFTNTETGESADSASFESSEPQDDTNYVTQEDWNTLVEQNERLIAEYEDSQTDDSSGGGGSSSSGFLSGEWMGVPKAGWLFGGLGGSLLGYELFSDDDDHGRRGGGRY